MNQRIINNHKVFYRKRILNKLILNIKQKTTITLLDCISEVLQAQSNDVTSEIIEICFSKARFNNKIIGTDVEVPVFQQECEIVQCDGIPLQDYLNINEDIGVYESLIDDDFLGIKKNENPGEDENKNEDKHTEEQLKFTVKNIINAFSDVRNGLRQQRNVPYKIFNKLNEQKHFMKKVQFIKNQ